MKRCVGVEFLEGLYDLAALTSIEYMSSAKERFPDEKIVPIDIIQGDMLKVDWSDADIIYASSICFPDELVDGIAD